MITILSPFPIASQNGNSVSARRIADRLRDAGYAATATATDRAIPDDSSMLIAINAWRLSSAVRAFAAEHPAASIIVVLAGSDLYDPSLSNNAHEHAHRAMAEAAALVVSQPAAVDAVPESFRSKCRVISKSVDVSKVIRPRPCSDHFNAVVLSHLRAAKDPLLAARAMSELPPESSIRVRHYGMMIDDGLATEARRLTASSSRYRWVGGIPRRRALDAIASADVFINSSLFEGGANAVCEAIALGTPVVATRIPGNTGFLGGDYPGLFPPGDARALATLLRRCETSAAMLARLNTRCGELAPAFAPEHESRLWAGLVNELTS